MKIPMTPRIILPEDHTRNGTVGFLTKQVMSSSIPRTAQAQLRPQADPFRNLAGKRI